MYNDTRTHTQPFVHTPMLMNWLRSSVAYEFMADGILIEFDGGHKKTFPLIWHGPLQFNTDTGALLIPRGSVSVFVYVLRMQL